LALLEISVVPVGTESASFSSVVSQALHEAQRNGIRYTVSPTSTVMEGDLPALMDIAQKMHRSAFNGPIRRVVTNISIDERRDKDQRMKDAVAAAQSGI